MTLERVLPLLLLAQIAAPASADVAGTGSFSVEIAYGGASDNLDATFDDATWDVLGESVNLGVLVGSYTSTMNLAVNGASFTDVSSDAALSFSSNGYVRCYSSCGTEDSLAAFFTTSVTAMSGTAVDSGPGTLPVGSGIVYAFDGAGRCAGSPGFGDCTGTWALNVFQAYPTPAGASVTVAFSDDFYKTSEDAESSYSVDVTFATVTTAGNTLAIPASGDEAGYVPDFVVHRDDYHATYIDVSTTAAVSGDIETCTTYPDENDDGLVDGTAVPEEEVRLLHEEGGVHQDRTSSLDTVANRVCATTTSLGSFVVALPAPEPQMLPATSSEALWGLLVALIYGGALLARGRRDTRTC